MALVPLVPTVQWSQTARQSPRPDSTFVTHLLATAEHVPQTCWLRRATPADAQSAYAAHLHPTERAGVRTRHLI